MSSKTLWSAILALALLSSPTFAAKSLEDAIEAKTDGVILPSTDTGTVIFTNCRDCAPANLHLTKESKFYVGNEQVSLAQLNRFVSSDGPYFLTVFHKIKGTAITRIVVVGQFTQPKKKQR